MSAALCASFFFSPPGIFFSWENRRTLLRSPMSYPQGYLYQPPGSLALYSCPAYGASALAAPRNEDLARSSSGSAFSPYPGSAAFSASAGAGFSSPLSYSTDPATGFPSYMVKKYLVCVLLPIISAGFPRFKLCMRTFLIWSPWIGALQRFTECVCVCVFFSGFFFSNP